MPQRIPVFVQALDAISEMGVTASLKQRPEVLLVARSEATPETVALLVVENVDDAAMRMVHEARGRGVERIVVVAGTLTEECVMALAQVGVRGVARRRDATPSALVDAVSSVSRGAGTVPADLVSHLLKQLSRLQNEGSGPRGRRFTGITERETNVLRLVSHGYDTQEIASELCYSERTVKNTLHAINTRFQLRNRSHAVAYAIREGFI
ncbi:response regulator transcription factor [Streptomyces sp. NPDC090021]|uniref:helix-turn-helix transcriptional regulator n=1 Tax=Streptomyces sp. NPDC090021 TaxID=3365919 RepID=UPI00380B7D4E